jgi:signal peptide peptidase SppA
MKYSHLISYVASVPWAIETSKMAEIMAVIAFRASGQSFTQEELRARLGNEEPDQAEASRRGAIAVIPVRGVIAHRMGSMHDTSGGTSCERISRMIDAVAADPNITTIAYDFDTPGGTVPGVQELAAKMFALRGVKRQVAMLNGLAASAGYWLAAQCDEIVSIPSGSAGSIGVFTVISDLTEALAKEGVKVDVIRAGKFKAEGNPYEPLSEEGRAFIQARVDEAYAQFTKDVARGRGVSVADVRGGFGEGRALTAPEAKKAGLIDRIETFEGTLARLSGRRAAAGMRAEGEELELEASTELVHPVEPTAPSVDDAARDADRARRFQLL